MIKLALFLISVLRATQPQTMFNPKQPLLNYVQSLAHHSRAVSNYYQNLNPNSITIKVTTYGFMNFYSKNTIKLFRKNQQDMHLSYYEAVCSWLDLCSLSRPDMRLNLEKCRKHRIFPLFLVSDKFSKSEFCLCDPLYNVLLFESFCDHSFFWLSENFIAEENKCKDILTNNLFATINKSIERENQIKHANFAERSSFDQNSDRTLDFTELNGSRNLIRPGYNYQGSIVSRWPQNLDSNRQLYQSKHMTVTDEIVTKGNNDIPADQDKININSVSGTQSLLNIESNRVENYAQNNSELTRNKSYKRCLLDINESDPDYKEYLNANAVNKAYISAYNTYGISDQSSYLRNSNAISKDNKDCLDIDLIDLHSEEPDVKRQEHNVTSEAYKPKTIDVSITDINQQNMAQDSSYLNNVDQVTSDVKCTGFSSSNQQTYTGNSEDIKFESKRDILVDLTQNRSDGSILSDSVSFTDKTDHSPTSNSRSINSKPTQKALSIDLVLDKNPIKENMLSQGAVDRQSKYKKFTQSNSYRSGANKKFYHGNTYNNSYSRRSNDNQSKTKSWANHKSFINSSRTSNTSDLPSTNNEQIKKQSAFNTSRPSLPKKVPIYEPEVLPIENLFVNLQVEQSPAESTDEDVNILSGKASDQSSFDEEDLANNSELSLSPNAECNVTNDSPKLTADKIKEKPSIKNRKAKKNKKKNKRLNNIGIISSTPGKPNDFSELITPSEGIHFSDSSNEDKINNQSSSSSSDESPELNRGPTFRKKVTILTSRSDSIPEIPTCKSCRAEFKQMTSVKNPNDRKISPAPCLKCVKKICMIKAGHLLTDRLGKDIKLSKVHSVDQSPTSISPSEISTERYFLSKISSIYNECVQKSILNDFLDIEKIAKISLDYKSNNKIDLGLAQEFKNAVKFRSAQKLDFSKLPTKSKAYTTNEIAKEIKKLCDCYNDLDSNITKNIKIQNAVNEFMLQHLSINDPTLKLYLNIDLGDEIGYHLNYMFMTYMNFITPLISCIDVDSKDDNHPWNIKHRGYVKATMICVNGIITCNAIIFKLLSCHTGKFLFSMINLECLKKIDMKDLLAEKLDLHSKCELNSPRQIFSSSDSQPICEACERSMLMHIQNLVLKSFIDLRDRLVVYVKYIVEDLADLSQTSFSSEKNENIFSHFASLIFSSDIPNLDHSRPIQIDSSFTFEKHRPKKYSNSEIESFFESFFEGFHGPYETKDIKASTFNLLLNLFLDNSTQTIHFNAYCECLLRLLCVRIMHIRHPHHTDMRLVKLYLLKHLGQYVQSIVSFVSKDTCETSINVQSKSDNLTLRESIIRFLDFEIHYMIKLAFETQIQDNELHQAADELAKEVLGAYESIKKGNSILKTMK